MSLGEKISRDILVSTFFTFSVKIRGLVFIPLFTIGLSVADFGAFTQALGIATILVNLCALGLDNGIVHEANQDRDLATVFSTAAVITFVVTSIGALGMVVLAPYLSVYTLSSDQYTLLFVAAALYVPCEGLYRMARGYYQAQRRIQLFSAIDAADVWLLVGSVTFTIVILNGAVEHAFLAAAAAKAFITLVITLSIFSSVGVAVPSVMVARSSLTYSLPTVAGALAKHTLDKLDRIMLGFFIGASAVGIYSVAYSLAYLILLYMTPMSNSFFAEFSKLWAEEDYATIREYTATGTRYFAILAIPSIVGFYLIGEQAMRLLTTADVAAVAVIPLVLVSAGIFFRGVTDMYRNLFYATGDTVTPFYAQIVMVVANGLLNLVLIQFHGVNGAAVATIISFAIGAIAMGILFQRQVAARPDIRQLSKTSIAAVVMGGTMSVLGLPWIATVAVAPLVYFPALLAIGGISSEEVQFVKQAIIPSL